MDAERILRTAIYPALALLPLGMSSPAATAMLLAIGLQESKLRHRRQIMGPARGYWQFEEGGGVHGVLNHDATREHIQLVLLTLDYDPEAEAHACHLAIEHNDVLAAAFARLLLWTVPQGLPAADDPDEGWQQYLSAWRPGRPRLSTWDEYFEQGWQVVAEVQP